MTLKGKKTIIIIIVLGFVIIGFFLALGNSKTINQKIFSFVNPYNPLKPEINNRKSQISGEESWKDPRNLFPIFAYNIPSNSRNLIASLRIIEKGGINIIINGNFGWMPDPEKLRMAFKQLNNSDLKWIAIVENECKDDYIFSNSNDETNKDIEKYLKSFNDDFVYGWYIWDEPGKNRKLCSPFNLIPNDDFEDINRMVKQIRINSDFNSKLDFINLFPTYWSETKSFYDYENYLNAFYNSQEYKPRVLCFDHYPFLKEERGGFRKDYFANLEIIKTKANEWQIPFWMIVLTSGHDDYKNPTFEEIRFQVFSALAYGAKGIGYYLYSRSFEQIGYSSWILQDYVDDDTVVDSLHGPLYLPVKNLNKQIQYIGKFLNNSNSLGIVHLNDFPNGQTNIKIGLNDSLKNLFYIDSVYYPDNFNSSQDLLIGFFNDKDNHLNKQFLVVNKNFNKQLRAYIALSKNLSFKMLNKTNGILNELGKRKKIEIFLEPGDAELFILEDNN